MDAADAVHQEYQAHYRRLIGQMYALTADMAEAQDVVQEAFARVLARPLASWRPRTRVRSCAPWP